MATIFWVEDQFHWIDKFKPVLEAADFGDEAEGNTLEVHKFAESANRAINHQKVPPDIVILDANLNGKDDAGLAISKLIAERWPNVPLVYLSEYSGTGIEQKAFEQSEPQDFIAKHQQNIEQVLCWRIKALLRQKAIKQDNPASASEQTLKSGDLTIDLTTWNVYWHGERLMNPNNKARPLAPTPRKILKILVESSPRAVSTEQMAERLDSEKFNYPSYRQHIKTLRHSFEQASQQKQIASFIEGCSEGTGIVTFGDQGAYLWKK